MILSRHFLLGLTVAAIVVPSCTLPMAGRRTVSSDASSSPISVGPDVHVSAANPGWGHAEYIADADPAHPERLLVCAMPFDPARNARRSGIYISLDGGREWHYTKDAVGSRAGIDVADPACAYGLEGQAFFATLTSGDPARSPGGPQGTWETWKHEQGMRVYRSADGGRTWTDSLAAGLIDNENILVDRTAGPYRGRIYIHGHTSDVFAMGDTGTKLWLIYSTNGGRTFTQSAPTSVNAAWIQLDAGTILPDGTLLLPYQLYQPSASGGMGSTTLAVGASTDGGGHLSGPVRVASSRPTNPFVTGPPQMAADHSNGPFRGRAYFLWGEAVHDRTGSLGDRYTVVLSYSDDRGQTWSAPTRVSDERPRRARDQGPDIRLPVIAVNKDGLVGVAWYDRREDPKNRSHRLRFTASLDGGQTWLPSVPVSPHQLAFDGVRGLPTEASSDRMHTTVRPGPRLGLDDTGGDYGTLIADATGAFHAFWVDNRSRVGGLPQLYTVPVSVSGTVTRHGSPELAALEDVTAKLAMEYHSTASVWDADSLLLTLEYVLRNASVDTLTGPLKLRVTTLESELGPAAVLLAGNRREGIGTVLDLTAALPQGRLLPRQTSHPQWLRVKIGPIDPAMLDAGASGIASFDAKVFGHVTP